jgi:hypothetical protein
LTRLSRWMLLLCAALAQSGTPRIQSSRYPAVYPILSHALLNEALDLLGIKAIHFPSAAKGGTA